VRRAAHQIAAICGREIDFGEQIGSRLLPMRPRCSLLLLGSPAERGQARRPRGVCDRSTRRGRRPRSLHRHGRRIGLRPCGNQTRCRADLAAHEGTIEIDSGPGRGTRISGCVPA
jgi:hypothetical protein